MRFGLKWVAVNSNELKLWENDGTGLKIISRCLPGQKLKKKKYTKNSPHSYQHSWEYGIQNCKYVEVDIALCAYSAIQ